VKTFAAWTSPQAKAMFERAQSIVPTYKSAGGLPYGGTASAPAR
jgi:hypothetical protein